jgi:hypothetical protein
LRKTISQRTDTRIRFKWSSPSVFGFTMEGFTDYKTPANTELFPSNTAISFKRVYGQLYDRKLMCNKGHFLGKHTHSSAHHQYGYARRTNPINGPIAGVTTIATQVDKVGKTAAQKCCDSL